MEGIKDMKKMWLGSLSFLDNCYINSIIVIILVLYSSTIFDNINNFVANLYSFSIVKLIVLLLIVYVSPKDPTIGILLAVSYIVSLHTNMSSENFSSDYMTTMNQKMVDYSKQNVNKNNVTEEKESFFPLVKEDVSGSDFEIMQKKDTLSNAKCMDEYTPRYESISNVCAPVATFENELNAQGLNFPEGYDQTVVGSVL